MKKYIPNLITLLNLTTGLIAILFATQNQLEHAAYFVFFGIFLDFFDGFIARILDRESEIGVQLDSLADMVTSGVVPGIVMFQLLHKSDADWEMIDYLSNFKEINYLPFLALIIPLAAAYRLAKFNVDDRQDHDFIGLPTPAMTLFVISLPLISIYGKEWAVNMVNGTYFLVVTTVLGSILMNSELSLFSLKFSNFSLKDNLVKYLFLILTLLLIVLLKISAIPIIIILYIILSMANNLLEKKTEFAT